MRSRSLAIRPIGQEHIRMKTKKIWILNHYATNSYFNKGGRHFSFAKQLKENGYEPLIFCAQTRHNNPHYVDLGGKRATLLSREEIPYLFIKTSLYSSNGLQRIRNMVDFYRNLFPVAKDIAASQGKPDLILASSVHPLTLVAGIKIARKLAVPCICEVRDLWPESLVAYGSLKKDSLFAKALYRGEKWIYKNADRLIFTMEGGKDYITDQRWDLENGGPVDLNKVHHINNGVDLKQFQFNQAHSLIKDQDLEDETHFKVIYTGSIRKVNNVGKIVKTAELIAKKGYPGIKFLIYGEGTEKASLEKYCKAQGIQNVIFKGVVDKNKIPYILSRSDLNIMIFQQSELKKYGASLNKMFEYFASGKPTISDCEFGYDLIKRYECGITVDNADLETLANSIIKFYEMPTEKYSSYCNNAIEAAHDYDFQVLAKKLEKAFSF